MKTLKDIQQEESEKFEEKFIKNKQEDEEYYRVWIRDNEIKIFLSSAISNAYQEGVRAMEEAKTNEHENICKN